MKYVWMLTDSASDFEPPELYSSKKKAMKRLEELFEETLESFSYDLSDEEIKNYRNEFTKNKKMWFNLYEERARRNARGELLWARSCTITQERIR